MGEVEAVVKQLQTALRGRLGDELRAMQQKQRQQRGKGDRRRRKDERRRKGKGREQQVVKYRQVDHYQKQTEQRRDVDGELYSWGEATRRSMGARKGTKRRARGRSKEKKRRGRRRRRRRGSGGQSKRSRKRVRSGIDDKKGRDAQGEQPLDAEGRGERRVADWE